MFSILPPLFLYHCRFCSFIVVGVVVVAVVAVVVIANVIIITYPFLLL